MTVEMVAPRRPQTDTLHQALTQASTGTDLDRAYHSGYALGWMAAFVDVPELRDILTHAENSDMAVPYPMGQVLARYRMWGGGTNAQACDLLMDSGVLAGYKEATAERPDADECGLCERRLLTDDLTDAARCDRHGLFHDHCRQSICKDGLWPQGCYES